MQTSTLKEATAKLGVSPDDVVRYQTLGNRAIIQIELNLPQQAAVDHEPLAARAKPLSPEEEFRRKYPNIPITRPELFKLIGCMVDVPPNVSDKDLIIDAIESIYGEDESTY